jgi:hypothetical protein
MREWMSAFEKAKRLILQNEQLDFQGRGAPQITTTTASETDNSVETGAAASGSPPKESSLIDNISTTAPLQPQKPSIVMLSSSPESDKTSLAQSTSLTPLLVWEASRASLNSESTTTTTASPPMSPAQPAQSFASAMNANPATPMAPTSSSWGIPWALVPSMFQTGGEEAEIPPTPNSPHLPSFTDSDGHQVVWPTRIDDANVPKVDLVGYPVGLDTRNKELRHLFGGVGANEVVLSGMV